MRLFDYWRAADAWLLETKFQKASEWLHDRVGFSTLRSAQLCFALSCMSLLLAYRESTATKNACLLLILLSGSLVPHLEVMEFLRRKLGAYDGATLDLSGLISPNTRLAYCLCLFAATCIAILLKRTGVDEFATFELGFVIFGIICMIAGLYFAECKGKPRQPRRRKTTQLKTV